MPTHHQVCAKNLRAGELFQSSKQPGLNDLFVTPQTGMFILNNTQCAVFESHFDDMELHPVNYCSSWRNKKLVAPYRLY